MPAYVKALCREIAAQGSLLREEGQGGAQTAYIGGGTPTALPPGLLLAVVAAVRRHLCGAGGGESSEAELTVEANPGTVDAAYLKDLRESGVNRLSFGVQSFDDGLLSRIGRIHTGAQAREAVLLARAAGFENISIDLMYGLPGQTATDLQESVEAALALAPQHISIYGLQLEEGTVFSRQRQMGQLVLPDEDSTEAMYGYMTEELPARGYARYEISNFARPGRESRHNLGYWQDVPYRGFGAAAHSYWQGRRFANTADIEGYIRCIEAGRSPVGEEEPRTRTIAMEEYAFLALRTARGISQAGFAAKFGCALTEIYGAEIARLKEDGLLAERDGFVFLTKRGMKYGNLVFEKFLL